MMTTGALLLTDLTQNVPTVNETFDDRPRLLLLDDDRLYGHILKREAERLGFQLIVCQSIEEAKVALATFQADAAIVDYYLDSSATGEMAAQAMAKSLPVLMISASRPALPHSRTKWPVNVRRFLPKTVGPRIILEAALAEYWSEDRRQREFLEGPVFSFLWPLLVVIALALIVTTFIPAAAPPAPGLTPSAPGILWDQLEFPHSGGGKQWRS